MFSSPCHLPSHSLITPPISTRLSQGKADPLAESLGNRDTRDELVSNLEVLTDIPRKSRAGSTERIVFQCNMLSGPT